MKKAIIAVIALGVTAFGAQFVSDSESRDKQDNAYTLAISLSDSNVSTYQYKSESTSMTLKELLDKTGVEYNTEIRNAEILTQVEGVVATASRGWIPYVNNQSATLEQEITAQDLVEIKYKPYE